MLFRKRMDDSRLEDAGDKTRFKRSVDYVSDEGAQCGRPSEQRGMVRIKFTGFEVHGHYGFWRLDLERQDGKRKRE